MANILAVLDPDKKYVRKLTAFMARQDHLPFEIQGFDSRVRLHTYMQEHKISILLLSEQWKEEDFCGMADLIVLLVEKRSDENLEAVNTSFPASPISSATSLNFVTMLSPGEFVMVVVVAG